MEGTNLGSTVLSSSFGGGELPTAFAALGQVTVVGVALRHLVGAGYSRINCVLRAARVWMLRDGLRRIGLASTGGEEVFP